MSGVFSSVSNRTSSLIFVSSGGVTGVVRQRAAQSVLDEWFFLYSILPNGSAAEPRSCTLPRHRPTFLPLQGKT